MSDQQKNQISDRAQSTQPSIDPTDQGDHPLPDHDQYFSTFPSLSLWTTSESAGSEEERPNTDTIARPEPMIFRRGNLLTARQLGQRHSGFEPLPSIIHGRGTLGRFARNELRHSAFEPLPSFNHGRGTFGRFARDEQTQVTSSTARLTPPERRVEGQVPHEETRLHLLPPPEDTDRYRSYIRARNPRRMINANAFGGHLNREGLNAEYNTPVPGISQNNATAVPSGSDSQLSDEATRLFQPLPGSSQNGLVPDLQHVRTQIQAMGRIITITRGSKPPPANIEHYTALSTSETSHDPDCPICMDLYDDDQHVAIKLHNTPCPHIFGQSCLQEWANSGMQNAHHCPSCRQSIAGALAQTPEPPRHGANNSATAVRDPLHLAFDYGMESLERARAVDVHASDQLRRLREDIDRARGEVAILQDGMSRAQADADRALQDILRAQERRQWHERNLSVQLRRLQDVQANMAELIQRRQAQRSARTSRGRDL